MWKNSQALVTPVPWTHVFVCAFLVFSIPILGSFLTAAGKDAHGMAPPAASRGETFQLWFGCLLHCPGAHILVSEEDADVCPGGLHRH